MKPLLAVLLGWAASLQGPPTQTFGTGMQGCNGMEVPGANSIPTIGNDAFAITCTNAPPSASGVAIIGNMALNPGSDIFNVGIFIDVDFLGSTELFILDMQSNGNGVGFASIPIPNNSQLVGKTYYAQAIWSWGNICSLPPLGLSSSLGLAITLQPFSQTNTTIYPATEYPAGIGVAPLAIADLNRDGNDDAIVPDYQSNKISILQGSANGTFATSVSFSVGQGPIDAASGDLNGDGKPDVVTSNWLSNNISVLLGKGNGSFVQFVAYAVGVNPRTVAIADFNGNGKLDIVTANTGSNNISVLMGLGGGTFSAATQFAVGASPTFVSTGDFNGDGKTDVVATNNGSNNISILLGLGNGSFASQVTYTTGTYPYSTVVKDLNGDGNADIVATNYGSNNISVFIGTGTGTYLTPASYAVGIAPIFVASEDLDSNGTLDVVTADYGPATNYYPGFISVLMGSGSGILSIAKSYMVGSGPNPHYS
ncbi:MAG: VCBS repeat-containing protein [Planctomycetes bacterium]|nr:VCBS repeat-containing protein [Planctomycetota bacterium]